jgi:hypothetical protein
MQTSYYIVRPLARECVSSTETGAENPANVSIERP